MEGGTDDAAETSAPDDARRTASIGEEPPKPLSKGPPVLGTGSVVAEKYRLGAEIGRGGMGVVYDAHNVALGTRVAVKLITSVSDEAAERVVREARLAASIESEHVGKIFDVGTERGAPFVVMERLEGKTLASIVRERGRLPVSLALEYVLEACAGLREAHRRGIVHRDIKPSNLFLADRTSGSPKIVVLDFGIAKDIGATTVDEDERALTSTTALLGSPFYMAPEQVRSAREVDTRADVWSLGATLFELLTGRPPFVAATTPGVLAAVVADEPGSLRELAPTVPRAVERAVMRCLEKDPCARYRDAAELADALVHARRAPARPSAVVTASLGLAAAIAVVLVVTKPSAERRVVEPATRPAEQVTVAAAAPPPPTPSPTAAATTTTSGARAPSATPVVASAAGAAASHPAAPQHPAASSTAHASAAASSPRSEVKPDVKAETAERY